MMKCYINTFYEFNNYGTKLQNYALVSILSKYFDEVNTIYLINRKKRIQILIKRFFCIFPLITDKQKKWKNEFIKESVFYEFNKKLNYKYISLKDLKSEDMTNIYSIVGSDQVWSPNHLANNMQDVELFFMNYNSVSRRFSYAPSFGVDDIPNEMKKIYENGLKNINNICVREEQGKKIIEKIIDKEALVVPDPVFLLSKNKWEEIFQNEVIEKDYIFVYFLGNIENNLYNMLEKFSRETNKKIVYVTGNYYDKDNMVLSPNAFIEYISKASYVITDSFHSAAFSLIFQKPFQIFERLDVNQSSRIKNLIKKYKCEKCFVNKKDRNNYNYEINPFISDDVLNILDSERVFGNKYISDLFKNVK